MTNLGPVDPPIVGYRTPSQVRAQATALEGRESRARAAAAPDHAAESAPSEDGTAGELWLYGVVGGWWFGFDAESVAHALRDLDVDTLYVRVHSPGGAAGEGVAIANLLRNHRARVVVVVDGLAASAASVIAIAGDEIVMCPGSQLMLHDASMLTYGSEEKLLSDAAWIGKQSVNYSTLYAAKAGSTPEQWREKMRADNNRGTWYSPEEAVSAGLATRVGTVQAAGSPPVAPAEQLDDDEALARAAHDLAVLEQCVHPDVQSAWSGVRARTPKPPSASAVGSPIPTGTESAVAFSDEQMKTMRAQLGLPETADEAAITAAVTAVVEENLEERPTTPTASVPEGHAVLPQQALADLQQQAAAGAAAAETLRQRDRDAFLAAHADRFPPASAAAWSAAYDRDEQGTRDYLAAAPVLVPTVELGHAEDTEASTDPADAEDYWFSGFGSTPSVKG